MLKKFTLAVAPALVGLNAIAGPLANGVWTGAVDTTLVKADGKTESMTIKAYLDSCDGRVRLWTKSDNGKVQPLPVATPAASMAGTHLYYFADAEPKQPDWEELQTFSVLEMDEERVWLLWTRAVNNRDLAPTDAKRFFYMRGAGDLWRVGKACLQVLADPPTKP